MRVVLAIAGVAAFAAVAVMATSARSSPDAQSVAAAAVPAPRVTADPASFTRVDAQVERGRVASDDRTDRRRIVVRGLRLPIDGVGLPDDPDLLPNAPRDYRGGYHEGIDFPAPPGTPVHAVADGTILRIDHDFIDWDPESERIALYQAVQLGYTPARTLDLIRGRQVWIDHGNGVVTRYAHLSTVAELAVGDHVTAGDVIGAVGSSGYPEGGPHLHLEVRIGTSYLGDGLSGDALVAAVTAAFD
ncbi:MAG TPA: M23 family metallopeptidase [Candidatus Acidoferrales bacterium]|nr:M23 family metallopeptidase [Candidatus Acidoferrales bacterium]